MDVGAEIAGHMARIESEKEYDAALERYRKALKAAQNSPAAPLPADREVMAEYDAACEALAVLRGQEDD